LVQLRDASGFELWLRHAKVAGLGAARLTRWLLEPELRGPQRIAPSGPIAHQVRVPLGRAGANARLEAGKRHNVRLAATAFHGVVLTSERPLSFWRTLGPATEARGYTWGMELRSGCAVPAIGGGLCVISNALFQVAVELGWRIQERHAHSKALGDPSALDATVAFPHVDLRVAPRSGVAVLDVTVRGDVLILAARSDAPTLTVKLERFQREDHGIRETRIDREVWHGDQLIDQGRIVDDRQQLHEALATCLDCGATGCRARVTIPEARR
jgi:vancomycin resistance protein VanW